MKKFINILISLLIIGQVTVLAQKVLDKSGKKPDWVNGIEKDFIIASGSSETVEGAQQNALLRVKERIITSIAENVQTSSEYYRNEQSVNGVSNFIENFETSTKTKSAEIGFIKGISLSNVTEYYWEKVKEKDGTLKYYYSIKYPFSEMELKKMVIDFDMADKQLTEEMNDILDSINSITSVEQITRYIASMQGFSKAFLDQRKEKANQGINALQQMLNSIVFAQVDNKIGVLKYSLKIGDKTIVTATNPKVTSKCATVTDIQNNQTEWVITYNYSACYDDPSNAITVAYPFSPNAKKNFNFDINANKAEVFIKEAIVLSGGTDDGTSISGAKCNITLVSKYDSPVSIEKLTLNFDNCPPVVVDNIGLQFQGKGNQLLSVDISQALPKDKTTSTKKGTISGTLQYKSITGEGLTYKIFNQALKTSW